MRTITDHIVSGDQAHQLTITVVDGPGAGGANHRYEVTGFDTSTNPSSDTFAHGMTSVESCLLVLFQNGPIKESGVNGVTQEALLAIVIDRLRSFQAGPFACLTNELALLKCQEALAALQSRTMERIARGVEGTHEK